MMALLALLSIVLATALLGIVVIRQRLKNREEEARTLFQQGQLRRSIALLKTVVDADPANTSARWFLIHLYEHFNDYDAAISHARPFLARLATTASPDALDLPPECPIERFAEVMASSYIGLHRVTEALELIRILRQRVEAASNGVAGPAATLLKLQANLAERSGEAGEAIESWSALDRRGELEPIDAFTFGRLLFRRGRVEESLAPLERAAAALPDRREISEILAEAYTALGRHHDAWPILRTLYLATQGRDRVRIGRRYTENLEDVGNVKGAIETMTEIAEFAEATPIEAADLLCRAGDLLQKIEKPDEAKKRWIRAVDRCPEHEGACRRLGISPRPASTTQFIRYIRGLGQEAFRDLFARILTDWGYTIEETDLPNPDSLHFTVARIENGKERRKLVHVKRWENEVGQFPIQEFQLEVNGRKMDAGVFITMSHYSAKALLFAARSRVIELFSASEIFPLIDHLELPR
jgi:tetratricopeptide (TPR) repeat protein